MDKDKDMSRRRFLKMAALTGAAMCVGPTLNKVTAAERVWMGKQQVANNIPAGMAAVRTRRTLGHGNTAFEKCIFRTIRHIMKNSISLRGI